jgi:hypothetical protein
MLALTAQIIGILVVPTWSAWLWFMVVKPARWAAYVEWENGWLVRRGWVSPGYARFLMRTEKGFVLKVVVGMGIMAGMLIILFPAVGFRG